MFLIAIALVSAAKEHVTSTIQEELGVMTRAMAELAPLG